MENFPIFLRVAGRRCLVVGGGEVALRKVEALLRAGAEVVVVAPRGCAGVEARAEAGELRWEARRYGPADLDGAHLVIAATDVREINAAVSRDAQARRLPVNVVDDPDLCTFIVPAVVERGPVVVAISTGGASPTLARMLRARVEAAIPEGVGALAELLKDKRAAVRDRLADPEARRAFWDRIVGGEVAGLAFSGRIEQARRVLEGLVGKLK